MMEVACCEMLHFTLVLLGFQLGRSCKLLIKSSHEKLLVGSCRFRPSAADQSMNILKQFAHFFLLSLNFGSFVYPRRQASSPGDSRII